MQKEKKVHYLWLLDETATAMGGRMLKQWIDRPLLIKKQIERRQSLVETLIKHYFESQDFRELFKGVYDLGTSGGTCCIWKCECTGFYSIEKVPYANANDSMKLSSDLRSRGILTLAEKLDPCEEVTDLLEKSIVENPPISIKEGDVIKDGFNEELDKYRDASRNGKTGLLNWKEKNEKVQVLKP